MDIHNMFKTPAAYFLLYFVVINVYGVFVMGIDKWKSRKSRWRISEKTLFITAFIGGSIGIYAGMKLFHHKTLHNKFRYGIPLILILNIILTGYIIYKIQI